MLHRPYHSLRGHLPISFSYQSAGPRSLNLIVPIPNTDDALQRDLRPIQIIMRSTLKTRVRFPICLDNQFFGLNLESLIVWLRFLVSHRPFHSRLSTPVLGIEGGERFPRASSIWPLKLSGIIASAEYHTYRPLRRRLPLTLRNAPPFQRWTVDVFLTAQGLATSNTLQTETRTVVELLFFFWPRGGGGRGGPGR